ncbi:MAG: hypothetical protein HQ503_03510, partial [Rhodospirillales bacterium]|nr:hypothetical protein [Rhodospirillales bacterium]
MEQANHTAIGFSLALHAAVVIVSVVGLPHLRRPPPLDIPLVVELIDLGEETNVPVAKRRTPKKKEPAKAKVAEKPKPKPVPKVKKAPPAPTQPKLAQEVAAIPPPPEPKPKSKPKPKVAEKPMPKAKPAPEAKAPRALARAKPKRKPKPPETFASVLKNLEKDLLRPDTKNKEKPKKTKKKIKPEDQVMDQIAKAISQRPREFNPEQRVTQSELDAMANTVRLAMLKCWNFQPGAKGAA